LQGQKTILVFHLGGGSFDVSIIKIKDGMTYEVIAVAGDDTLGGEDFDSRLMEYFLDEFFSKHNVKVSDVRALRRLHKACELTKITLSTNTEAVMEIESFYKDRDFFSNITRDCFEQLCGDFFEKIGKCVENVIKEAKLTKNKISDVIMVGGSTHIPKIREMINKKFIDKQMNFTLDAAEVVVQGTAVQAAMLTNIYVQFFQELKMTDVAAFPMKIKINGSKFKYIFDKNESIPWEQIDVVNSSYLSKISSYLSAETLISYKIFEDKDDGNNNSLVQEYAIDIKHPRKFEVKLAVNENGVFNLSLQPNPKMPFTEREIECFNKAPHLDEDNISRMIKEAAHLATLDEQMRQCKLSRTKFLDCILYWEQAIAVEKEQQEFEDAHKDSIQKATRLELEWLDSNKYEDAEALHNHLINFDNKCEQTLADALSNSLPSWIFNVLHFERKSK
jgi:heat shock 70kDa protein 1/2/6/8